jgi:iron complex transport system substrate-binding protein
MLPLLLPALVVFPASCGRAPATGAAPGAKVFTDGLGREVKIAPPARRIVSIAPSNTEILGALGAGEQIVGRDDFSDHPPAVRALPSVGLSGGRIHREAVLSLRPDLVLAAEISPPEHVASLEALGLTVFLVKNPRSFGDLFANLAVLGEIVGREREAAELAGSLERRVREVERRVAGVSGRPLVFYELDATDPTIPWTAGAGTFIDMLIRMAGGENFGARFPGEFPRASVENLIKADPDVILIATPGATVELVRQRAGWAGLKAVKEGRVHVFDDNLASRPGPRLADGLEALARVIHPDLFSNAGRELPPEER